MSNPTITHGELETGDGPAPHEDLTIAEQLQMMRVPGEHRPGEQCFLSVHGEHLWVGDNDVQRFVTLHGADHSSDYRIAHGADWQDNLFSGT